MNCIMCVDNSGSTSNCKDYWRKVFVIHKEMQPNKLIYWNSTAEVLAQLKEYSEGGTDPCAFLELLKEETEAYNLIVTTDGEIAEWDMDRASKLVTPEMLSLIKFTTIHYVGHEASMNIGLSVIFGRTKKMIYYINNKRYELLQEKFDELNVDEFMSPNFGISLIVKIKNIQTLYPSESARQSKLAELRGEVCRLYSKLESESLDKTAEEKLQSYFENNQYGEFIDLVRNDKGVAHPVISQKAAMLKLFDSKIDFNISRISTAATIAEQDIKVESDDEDGAWNEFEDALTMDKFSLPCVLVQNTESPIITDKMILKHPFKLLSEPEIIKKILLLIEPNLIDYTTYQKLVESAYEGYIRSPFTRVACKGVFLFDTDNMKRVKNNCRAMSILFGNENKVPGNPLLWNLIIMYLIYKYKVDDTAQKDIILNEIVHYCKKFSINLHFTHHCEIPRRAKMEVCLWYCIQATPRVCPCDALCVLRSPFGLELLEFYLDTFGRNQDEYLKELVLRTRKWTVWNYLLVNKVRSDLKFEVQAQYQNYCVHNGSIILLSGKCDTPYKSKCNLVDPGTVNTLFANVKVNSKKLDDIDKFEPVPVHVDDNDLDGIAEEVTHVKINIKTCWPFVICPVTKLHWRKCIGVEQYDVKTESHIRVFNKYCCKYKKYPTHFMDLALFYSRKTDTGVLKKRDLNNFEYIFSLFQEVMSTYSCDEYLRIYKQHVKEEVRLTKEQS